MKVQYNKPTQYWVYDLETYPNVFTFSFRKVEVGNTITRKIFELSERKDEIEELIKFLKQDKLILIGYNSVKFDYPILHYILTSEEENTLDNLFTFVQDQLISDESEYMLWESDHLIPQIDLYLIWHYNNKARATSLKWLEFTTRWKKVQDLPFEPGTIIPLESIDDLINYNNNDVDFTYKFAEISKNNISFRQSMSTHLDHNVMNYSDVKIGEFLNRVTYSKLSGIPFRDFKNGRTERSMIPIIDLIPDFVQFKTPQFKAFLEEIKTESINANTKGDWEKHITIGKMNLKFAKGGLHSDDSPGIIKCKENHYLKEKDVGSMYPKAIIAGNFYPDHLGEDWTRGIKLLYDERADELKPLLKTLKSTDPNYIIVDSKQAAYKEAMNGGGYGKTGAEFGWQKDKMVMFKVTFRGQLSLLMLLEEYFLLGGVELISANTDGIVIQYDKSLNGEIQRIHDEWEIMTDSILEDTFYRQIISRDVNNYIAEIIDGDSSETIKFKFKGCFDINPDYHKNNSQRIVPYAIKEYFINNTPISDTIRNHSDIFDFCIGRKSTKKYKYSMIKGDDRIDIPDKVVRYYIAANGHKMFKIDTSTKEKDTKYSAVNKGFLVTPFMDYYESDNYDIDYTYYISECNKIIKPIEKNTLLLTLPKSEQLTLF